MNMPNTIGKESDEPARIDAIRGSAGGTRVAARRCGAAADGLMAPCHAVVVVISAMESLVRGVSRRVATAPRAIRRAGLVLTLTTTDMPGRSSSCVAQRRPAPRMRTGRRCTILVKLPVALSGGSSENTEPEAGATLATRALDVVAGQRVDRDRHRLARAAAGELRLLEVGVDVDVVERHQAGEPLARLHVVADLHGAVADDAVERARGSP